MILLGTCAERAATFSKQTMMENILTEILLRVAIENNLRLALPYVL